MLLHQIQEGHSITDLFHFETIVAHEGVVKSEDILLGDLAIIKGVHEISEWGADIFLDILVVRLVSLEHESNIDLVQSLGLLVEDILSPEGGFLDLVLVKVLNFILLALAGL